MAGSRITHEVRGGFYHEEDSRHRHHEPAEFVCEGLKGLRLAGHRVHSLHSGVLGFKLGPQLLLRHTERHASRYHMTYHMTCISLFQPT